MEFQGKELFLQRMDAAINGDCPFEITTCLRKALVTCIADEAIRLPDEVFETLGDHYARRQIFHCPRKGFSVIAMTWGPGQGTLIHDHSGMWCVEGVWSGCIEVVSFEPREQQGDRYRFEEVGSIVAGSGSAGSLIPPHEYHTIRNPDLSKPAVSVHVYAGEMTECNMFEPLENGWYEKRCKSLQLDAA